MTVSLNPTQRHAKTPNFGLKFSGKTLDTLTRILNTNPALRLTESQRAAIDRVTAIKVHAFDGVVSTLKKMGSADIVLDVVRQGKRTIFKLISSDGRKTRVKGSLTEFGFPTLRNVKRALRRLHSRAQNTAVAN